MEGRVDLSGYKDNLPRKPTSSEGKNEKGDYHTIPPFYSLDPQIPHPRINNVGVPPKIDAISSFSQWQYLMKSYLCSSCVELWRIVQKG